MVRFLSFCPHQLDRWGPVEWLRRDTLSLGGMLYSGLLQGLHYKCQTHMVLRCQSQQDTCSLQGKGSHEIHQLGWEWSCHPDTRTCGQGRGVNLQISQIRLQPAWKWLALYQKEIYLTCVYWICIYGYTQKGMRLMCLTLHDMGEHRRRPTIQVCHKTVQGDREGIVQHPAGLWIWTESQGGKGVDSQFQRGRSAQEGRFGFL